MQELDMKNCILNGCFVRSLVIVKTTFCKYLFIFKIF